MKIVSRGLLSAFVALLIVVTAWAGPFEDADARFRAGDYQGAATLLLQAQKETPNDVRVYAALGRTYRKLGDNDRARDAYTEFLRRDPNLRTLKSDTDRQNFLKAFRSLGGQIPAAPNSGGQSGGQMSAQDIIRALTSGNVFVVPGLRNEVNADALESAVASVRPVTVKVVVVAKLGGYPSREALAEDLRKRLTLNDDAVVVVATPKGVSASSGRLSNEQIAESIRQAKIDQVLAASGPTEMIATAIRAVAGESGQDKKTDTGGAVGLVAVAGLGLGGFWLYRRNRYKARMDAARRPVDTVRDRVIADLSYVDGYLDVLPPGPDTDRAKELRASAFGKYDTATGFVKSAKTPKEVEDALPLLNQAAEELVECRKAIDRATGGTGVAMGLLEIPSLATDLEKARQYREAEELKTASERAEMRQAIENLPPDQRGVSFFSGRPMPSDTLIPVTLVITGQKRTVMATPDEAAMIQRGILPPVRAFRDPMTSRYIPWYEYRTYDPYRDYYAYDGVLLDASILIDLTTIAAQNAGATVYGGYSPWGFQGYGYGMPNVPSGYVYYDATPSYPTYDDQPIVNDPPYGLGQPEHAGGMDLFGQQDYQEQGSGFDTSDSSSTDAGSSSWDSGSSSSWDSSSTSDSGGSFDSGSSSSSDSSFGGGGDW